MKIKEMYQKVAEICISQKILEFIQDCQFTHKLTEIQAITSNIEIDKELEKEWLNIINSKSRN